MKQIVQNSPVTEKLIHYFPDGSAMVLQNNIITPNNMIYPDSLYILRERSFYTVVRVKKIWDTEGIVNLKVQDQDGSGRVYNISQVIDPDIKYFVWYLFELNDIFRVLEDRIMMGLIVGKTFLKCAF
ncbi:MAG: hypothetical protein K9J25_07920 [Bacteroidales bacterium]|nr:hypothetical protein [Bacteroidales bacterium]